MATKKFSEFDLVPTPVLADIVVVGLDDLGQNAQFPGDVFGGAAWGDITGTLADQTDLVSELNGKEDSLGNPGTSGYLLSSTDLGVRSWVAPVTAAAWGSITGTLSAQTDLNSALGGKEDSLGNPGTSGYVLSSTDAGVRSWVAQTGGGGGTWGSITGTLSAQTDLQSALDAKLATVDAPGYLGVIKPFAYKAAGEVNLGIAFGDSNMDGLLGGDAAAQNTPNANVYVYCTDGKYPYDISTRAWRNLHPNGPGQHSTTAGTGTLTLGAAIDNYQLFSGRFSPGDQISFVTTYSDGSPGSEVTVGIYNGATLTRVTVLSSSNGGALVNWSGASLDVKLFRAAATSPAPSIGIIQGGAGNIGWSMADYIQKATNEPFYLFECFLSGTNSEYWLPGGGAGKEGMNTLTTYLSAAIAAIPGTAPTFADVVFMEDGTNDAGNGGTPIPAATFVSNWESTYAEFVSQGWIDPDYTQWFQGEPAQEYWPYSTDRWEGIDDMLAATGDRVSIASSLGMPTTDNVHFVGSSLIEKGRNAGRTAVLGLTLKNPGVQALNSSYLYNLVSTIADSSTAVGFTFNTPAYANATAKMLDIQRDSVSKVSMDKDGNVTFAEEIATPTFFSNFSGFTYFNENMAIQAGKYVQQSMANTASENGFTINAETGGAPITASGAKLLVVQNDGTNVFTVDKDGYLAKTVVQAPQVTHSSTPTPTLMVNNVTETLDFGFPTIGEQFKVAGTYVFNLGTALATGSAISVANAYSNTSGSALNFNIPASIRTNSTFTAANAASAALTWADVVSGINTAASGGSGAGTVTLLNHFFSEGVIGASTTVTYRTVFNAANLTTVTGTLTNQVGFTSSLTGATNNTHVLMGSALPAAGNWALYQADTLPNRFNGGVIAPLRAQNGASAAVSVKGDRNLVFANGSTSTITFPTLTSMTTGHTAAQMTGYELVLINDRTTAVVSGTDFLLGAGTSWGFGGTFTLAAKESRTFVWDGTSVWL